MWSKFSELKGKINQVTIIADDFTITFLVIDENKWTKLNNQRTYMKTLLNIFNRLHKNTANR